MPTEREHRAHFVSTLERLNAGRITIGSFSEVECWELQFFSRDDFLEEPIFRGWNSLASKEGTGNLESMSSFPLTSFLRLHHESDTTKMKCWKVNRRWR